MEQINLEQTEVDIEVEVETETKKNKKKKDKDKGKFSHEYNKGKKIELLTLNYFKNVLKMKIEDLSEDESFQKKDIDFKGNDDYYEIKGDFSEQYYKDNGEYDMNIFFETHPNSDSVFCGKAWTQICEADYLLYNYVNYNKSFKIDWKKFKDAVLSEFANGNYFRIKHNVSYDINQKMVVTYGLVINYSFFKDYIVEEFDIDFSSALKKEKRPIANDF